MSPLTKSISSDSRQRQFIASLVIATIAILIVVNVYMAAEISHLGINLQAISVQQQQLAENSQQLNQQIHQAGSLHDLRQKAEMLGFSNTSEYQYLDSVPPVAVKTE